jgi:hypothetical protein
MVIRRPRVARRTRADVLFLASFVIGVVARRFQGFDVALPITRIVTPLWLMASIFSTLLATAVLVVRLDDFEVQTTRYTKAWELRRVLCAAAVSFVVVVPFAATYVVWSVVTWTLIFYSTAILWALVLGNFAWFAQVLTGFGTVGLLLSWRYNPQIAADETSPILWFAAIAAMALSLVFVFRSSRMQSA